MNIKDWFKNSRSVKIDHGETSPTSEDGWAKAIGRKLRTDNLLEIVMVGTLTIPAVMGYIHADNKVSDIAALSDGSVYSQQDVVDQMGHQSRILHGMAGDDRLTIISQNDPNIDKIVSNLSSDELPETRPRAEHASGDVLHDVKRSLDEIVIGSFKGNDKALQYYALDFVERNKDRAHVLPVDMESGDRFCYAQVNNKDMADFPDGKTIDTSSPEAKLYIGIHEVTHCMDFSESYHTREASNGAYAPFETLQSEVIADATSAIMLASRTNNWDFFENTIRDFRNAESTIGVGDLSHATLPFLEKIVEQVDLSDHKDLSLRESYELATSLYKNIDFEKTLQSLMDDQVVFQVSERVQNGEAEYLTLNEKSSGFWKDKFNVTTDEGLKDHLKTFSEGHYKDHLNHIIYSGGVQAHDQQAVLDWGKKLANSFDNEALKNSLEKSEAQLESGGDIDVNSLLNAIGHDATLENQISSPESNNQKISGLYAQIFEADTSVPSVHTQTGYPGYDLVTPEVAGFDQAEAQQNFAEKHRSKTAEHDLGQ